MFHYVVPHCTVAEGTMRIMRASDGLEIAHCPELKGAKLWLDHTFGCAIPRNTAETNYLQKQRQQCARLPHLWNRCAIQLDNETADAIGVAWALELANWKPVKAYAVMQCGTTGISEHQHEEVELVANTASQHRSDATGTLFTTQWTLSTPFRDGAKLAVTLDVTFPHQEFITLTAQPSIWLGSVQVSGKIVAADGTSTEVTGEGFLQSRGKDSFNNFKQTHGMMREVSTARMEDPAVSSMKSLSEIVGGPAASATSTVKTLMNLQGQSLSDAHLVMLTSLLGAYGQIFHHPMAKKEVLEALQWCHGKWLGYFGSTPIDVKTLMLRSFMLRELSFVLQSRCAAWIPAHVQVIDLVMDPPSHIEAVVLTDKYAEEFVTPSPAQFGAGTSKLDLSQLRADFSGTWILDLARGTANLNVFLSAQGVPVLWRNFVANAFPALIITVDEDKQLVKMLLQASFLRRREAIPLDGSYREGYCAARGGLRTRACVLPGGTGLCVETVFSSQMVERKWYTVEDGGKTLVEAMRVYEGKDGGEANGDPCVRPPISVCVRYFTLCLEKSGG
ncbi:uncharacterized protein Tco025E_05538 [Trypanosoma conorhini]|uniref:AttH domain-containing protein n=1 Tax=Trypanosoma conorhini TaxID=83891 RepID=A0A3R7RXS6_9TRYP|nr:uncharacterized protein Tco025E_05538 [Trypanosoma conorhini]RNF15387.1 hypothetical protein Tco025E_05538 [Trypanosoma conorhini]